MRNLCLLLCTLLPGLFASGLLFAEPPSHAPLSLFGVPFPQNGAHVLLAVDSSEAMNTPFSPGLPNETRWQAVRRSVRRLADDMAGQAAGRHVFRITVLFCGGSSYHRGSEQIWIRNPRDTERLMSVFSDRIVGGRRNTGNVLRNELWSLAARDGITDICLVDCPPQKTEPSSPNNPLYTVEDWYTLTPDTPITSRRRQEIRNAKLAWFATWRHPNPRRGRRKTHPMPPPPRSGIRFSCVTFGGDTPDYRKIAELGRGVCTVPDRPAEANEQTAANAKNPTEHRYEVSLYDLPIPERGSNLLLILDASGSMNLPDTSRRYEGSRWQTLLDEVRRMGNDMIRRCREKQRIFNVTVLFDGGPTSHTGSEPIWIRSDRDLDRLTDTIRARKAAPPNTYKATFCRKLWPLVAQNHITDTFVIGDDDIGHFREDIHAAVEDWYTLPDRCPDGRLKQLWTIKKRWCAPWLGHRCSAADILADRCAPLPPRTEEVSISAIAIGEKSVFLKELAKHCNGRYIERISDSTPALNTPGNTQP